ncbi:MAG: ABC transporter permease [Planctomycetota bacterium]
MNKVLAIARAEYTQAVRSKAFLIGILAMPILMGAGIAFQIVMEDRVDLSERRCAVFDASGQLWPALEAAAERRNAEEIWELDDNGERSQTRPEFVLERFVPSDGKRADVVLSERVRAGELQGFVLLDATVLDEEPGERPFAYHTNEPTFTELPNWLGRAVNDEVQQRRLQEADVAPEIYSRLSRRVPLSTWGLLKEREDGTVEEAEEENDLRTFAVPFGGLMLLFLIVMTAAPQLMNQVLEEKMQRIAEVLVSAVSPFQLMLGKLLGSVCISLTLAAIYLGGVFWATHHYGVSDLVPASTYPWFIGLMVFALLMYGSLFSALGSACSELRDAQSLMMPAMIVLMVPMFALSAIIESPNGSIAVGLTYFPTATPMVLLLRVLAPPGPPAWEYIAGPLMCLATTGVLLWASSKIFRIGILAQGQTPSFRTLLGWIVSR